MLVLLQASRQHAYSADNYAFGMDKMIALGKRIRSLRESRGLTLEQLASKCGVTHPALLNWENGRAKSIRTGNFMALCRELKVRPTWLWTGKGPRDKALSDEATELGAIYDELPREMQAQILAGIRALKDLHDADPKRGQVIHLLPPGA